VHHLPIATIFIPTYNDETDLSACLESIRNLDYPKAKLEIIIWDNASDDSTVKMIEERFAEMKNDGWLGLSLIEHDRNEGSYIPYNLVLPKLSQSTQYILGLDADIELSRDTLKNLIEVAKGKHVAVVGARSVFYDSPEMTAHGAGFVNRWTGMYNEEDALEKIKCDYVIGCCWLLKKSIFEQLAGFDRDYYICHWEVDYCLRAIEKGYSIIYEPKAVVKHKILPAGSINKERLYYLCRNKILLIKKLLPPLRMRIALTLHVLFGFPKNIIQSIRRNGKADFEELKVICKAFADGLRNKTGKVL